MGCAGFVVDGLRDFVCRMVQGSGFEGQSRTLLMKFLAAKFQLERGFRLILNLKRSRGKVIQQNRA